MRLEDQVVGRILERQQGVVPQRPAGRLRPAVALDHDGFGLVDRAHAVDTVLGSDRPLGHGVVRLVHDVVGIERRLTAPALGDTGHDLLVAVIGHCRAADHRAAIEGVVVQIEDDPHAVLLRIGKGLVHQRGIGRIQRTAQHRLQSLPDDRETNQLDPLGAPLLEVGLHGKDVVRTVHTRQHLTGETGTGQIQTDQADLLGLGTGSQGKRSDERQHLGGPAGKLQDGWIHHHQLLNRRVNALPEHEPI